MTFLDEVEDFFGTRCLYEVLNIDKEATENEIKKAYRRTSLKVHPDRVGPTEKDKATQKFQVLAQVHYVLSDQERRKLYDDHRIIANDDSRHRRQHYDESFYTGRSEVYRKEREHQGRSEVYRKEREHQDSIDRIKAINERLLEDHNAKLQRGNSSKSGRKNSTNRSNSGLYRHIMPELDDDEFEKLILTRLRSMAEST